MNLQQVFVVVSEFIYSYYRTTSTFLLTHHKFIPNSRTITDKWVQPLAQLRSCNRAHSSHIIVYLACSGQFPLSAASTRTTELPSPTGTAFDMNERHAQRHVALESFLAGERCPGIPDSTSGSCPPGHPPGTLASPFGRAMHVPPPALEPSVVPPYAAPNSAFHR